MKRILGFILTIFITASTLLYSDSTNTIIDSTKSKIISQLDVGEDNFETNFTFTTESAQLKWYESPLSTTLIGSFLAAFIAVVSILATNYINRRNTNRKQLKKYKSLLFGIYSELRNNEMIIDLLVGEEKNKNEDVNNGDSKGEIEIYIDTVQEYRKLVSADVFSNLQVRFIEQCRLNLIDNESFALDVLEITSRYIDIANSINNSLKSGKIQQIQTFRPAGVELHDAAKIYFDEITKRLNNLKTGGNELRRIILIDANRFPNIDPYFEDSSLENENQENEKQNV